MQATVDFVCGDVRAVASGRRSSDLAAEEYQGIEECITSSSTTCESKLTEELCEISEPECQNE